VPPCWEGLSVWTTKYTWIHWYLCDGNNQFTLVPQKHWQPPRTEHDLGTSTARPEETDDSLLNYFSRSSEKLRSEKLAPGTDMTQFDTHRGIVDPSAPAPQYLEFLRKYGFDGATTTSPSISRLRISGSNQAPPWQNTLSISGRCQRLYTSLLSIHVAMMAWEPADMSTYTTCWTSTLEPERSLTQTYSGHSTCRETPPLNSLNPRLKKFQFISPSYLGHLRIASTRI
jgi:hypothetical protein